MPVSPYLYENGINLIKWDKRSNTYSFFSVLTQFSQVVKESENR